MSIETAVVIDKNMRPLHWHLPPGRSSVYIPDSRDLWEVMWENRDNLLGVAHSHPGFGLARPSWEDITTFQACEEALGKRLDWWIITQSSIELFRYQEPELENIDPYGKMDIPPSIQDNYQPTTFRHDLNLSIILSYGEWLPKLYELSYGGK